jgi:HAMP domain-containing protein
LKLARLSIRWRLTLWYVAILAVLLAVFSSAVYYSVQSAWERSLDDRQRHDFETVRTYLDLSPVGKGDAGHLPGDVFFMAARDNKVLYHSDSWCRAGLLKRKSVEMISEQGVWRSSRGQAFRLKSAPMYTGGRVLQVTVAGHSRHAGCALHLGDPGGHLRAGSLGCAIGAGYFMAGRSLAPIGKMATKARLITAERLSERLPIENPNDEIGRMAVVMNETLSRLETSFAQLKAYTANISHELRTPLTAIRSVGEVSLQRAHGAEELREAIGSMLEEVDAGQLVDCS